MALTSLPPSVLSQVTRWLRLHETVRLVKLSGDQRLWQLCSKHGGVTEVTFGDQRIAEGSFFINPALVYAFAQLHTLIVSDEVHFSPPSGWITHLPSHMTEIEAPWFAFFTRAVAENDDDYLKCTCSTRDYLEVPINLAAHFPHLRALTATSSSGGTTWRKPMIVYFLEHLPTSLTSLDLHWPYSYRFRAMEQHMLKFTLRLPDLISLHFSGNTRSPFTLSGLLPDSSILDGNDGIMPSISAHLPPAFHCLQSLLLRNVVSDKSLGLLPYFTSLRELSLDTDKIHLAKQNLPPRLTVLQLTAGQLDPDDLTRPLTIPNSSELISLELDLSSDDISVLEFGPLPPKLQTLRIPYMSAELRFLHPLPKTLTRLSLHGTLASEPSLELHTLPALTAIDLNEAFEETLSKAPSLPALRDLDCSTITYNNFKALPKTVTAVGCSVELEVAHMDEIHSICKDCSRTGISSYFEKQFMSHCNPDDCWLRASTTEGWLRAVVSNDALWQSFTALDLHSFPTRPLLLYFEEPGSPLPALPSGARSSENGEPICIKSFPPNLESLTLNTQDRPLLPTLLERGLVREEVPEEDGSGATATSAISARHFIFLDESSKQQASSRHALPSTLRSLHLPSPETVHDTNNNLLLYPLLSQLPRLETLKLSKHRLNTAYLPSLPDTITDLTLSYSSSLAMVLELPSFAQDQSKVWLPNLRRLTTEGVQLALRSVINRLPSMEDLTFDSVMLHADIFPPLDGLVEINDEVLTRIVLIHLLPPRMRHISIHIRVEWNESVFRKLPATLERLVLPRQTRGARTATTAPPMDLGALLPPNLRYLDIQQYDYPLMCEGGTAFPSSLQTLIFDNVASSIAREDAADFMRLLPPTLTTLDFLCKGSSQVLSEAFISAIPRNLTHLVIRGPGVRQLDPAFEVMRLLPPRLNSLQLRLLSFNIDVEHLKAFAVLPQSLVYLTVDSARPIQTPPTSAEEQAAIANTLRDCLPNLAFFTTSLMELTFEHPGQR